MDFMSPETRSRVMSHIRGRNTKPEMVVRKYLHGRGLRYSLHDSRLPGKPDIVFRSRKIVVFVHGCFWHGHEGCPSWKMPQSRTEYWQAKLQRNRDRDAETVRKLKEKNWQVVVLWACQLGEDALASLYKLIAGHPAKKKN
ncbi:very short patch repair endonuclease [Lysobacter enzymogenes]|uniref:very short patch repair endonuclease n=1 Tax=Lysobacter enzymogenes TaxID=69 RepID=UPI00202874AC|nr:very short patch repair endonuclease [Lysobacter enzymogenes]